MRLSSQRQIWLVSVGAAVLLALWGWNFGRSWHPSDAEYPDQGFELSAESGAVNWVAARADGADFVYLDATDGSEVRSARFSADWQTAKAAGLKRGALHRFAICRLATDQATSFIAMVPRDDQALPPVLSLDADAGCVSRPSRTVLLQEVVAYIRMVEAHSGKPAILKISSAIEKEYRVSRAIDRPLWLSGFYLMPTYAERPWIMWEANGRRMIGGVDHRVPWSVVRP